jgi:histidine triad (HIT) family protein
MSDCLFCGIVNGSIKADVVYRDETVIAFKDIVPRAPVHVLIIPTAHIAMLSDLTPNDDKIVAAVSRAAGKLAEPVRRFFTCITTCSVAVRWVGLPASASR